MSSVDDRIVNMQFNNKQFEAGASQSTKTLQGLESTIAKTAQGKGLTSMADGVSDVSNRFSVMKVAGITAIATIASKATSAGLNMLKSFTIGPIMEGFREYQTGLDSIQTIMSNTGESVKVVNAGLDKLNAYSDQTIYNFAEMAKNVGTFTAAGVDLDTSIQSIKGIANLAALSGSNSQQASTAMYQLSQAIASGKVGLQDWNSVVNAGMGGKIFQTALANTAMNMGTLEKNAVKMVGPMEKLTVYGNSFRDSISAKPGQMPWLSSEVLVDTLKQISGGYDLAALRAKGYSKEQAKAILDLQRRAFDAATQIKTLPQLLSVVRESIGSSFSTVFRTILGDFEQSKKLWGDVGYAIMGPRGFLTQAQQGLEGFVAQWAKLGGRDRTIKALSMSLKAIGSVLSQVGSAFREAFPSSPRGNPLNRMAKDFLAFAEAITPSKDTLKSLKSIFGGVFAVLHIGWSIVRGVAAAFAGLISGIFSGSTEARGGILSIVAAVGEVLIAFDKWLTGGGKLVDFMGRLGNLAGAFIAPVIGAIGLVIKGFAALVSGDGIGAVAGALSGAKDQYLDYLSALAGGLSKITKPFEGVSEFFDGLRDKLANMKGSVGFGDLFSGVRASFSNFVSDILGLASEITTPFTIVSDFFANLKSKFDSYAGITEPVAASFDDLADKTQRFSDISVTTEGALTSISDSLEGARGVIVRVKDSVVELLESFGVDTTGTFGDLKIVLIEVLSMMTDGLRVYHAMRTVLFSVLSAFSKGLGVSSDVLQEMGTQIGTYAVDFLRWVDAGSKLKSLLSVIGEALQGLIAPSMGLVETATEGLSEAGAKAQSRWSSFGSMLSSLGAHIGTVFSELGAAAVWVKDEIGGLFKGTDALEVASLLNALFSGALILSLKKLSDGFGDFAGLGTSVVGSFDQLTGTLKTMQNQVKAQLILNIGIAVALLTASIVALSMLDPKEIAIGVGAIATMLGVLTGALFAMGKINSEMSLMSLGASILLISMAMINLAAAVAIFGNMDLKTLGLGLGGMAIALAIMIQAVKQFEGLEGAVISAGVSIGIMSGAMVLLAGAVLAFGSMDMGTLAKGLGSMAIGLGLMTNALTRMASMGKHVLTGAAAITLVSGAMLMLAAAVAAFGNMDIGTLAKGFGAMALGLIMFVTALNLLSANMAGVLAAGTAMVLMSTALAMLVPTILALGMAPWKDVAVGIGFVALALGVLIAAGYLAAMVAPGLVILSLTVMALGAAMLLAGLGMGAFAAGFAVLVGTGVAGVAFITAAIQAFLALLPTIAVQMAAGFVAFLKVLANAAPQIRAAVGEIVREMLGMVEDSIPHLLRVLLKFLNALDRLIEPAGQVIQKMLEEILRILVAFIPDLVEGGHQIIMSILEGLEERLPKIAEQAVDTILAFLEAISKQGVRLANGAAKAFLDFLEGLDAAIKKYDDRIADAGADIAESLIEAVLKGLRELGSRMADVIRDIDLPDIPMPDIPGIDLFSRAKMGAMTPSRETVRSVKKAVQAAVEMANAIISEGDKQVLKAQRAQSAAQTKAFEKDAKADITARRAIAARRAYAQWEKAHPKAKAAQKRAREANAKELERAAARQRKVAQEAQNAADKAAAKVEAVREFERADLIGKGDIKQEHALGLSNRASQMLARAQAEAAEAQRLMKINREAGRRMLKQAQKDAKAARELADAAKKANDEANSYYEQEVEARIKEMEDDFAFDAADTAGKAAILKARAEANEAKAAAEKAEALALLEQAKAIAATNAAGALLLVEQAEMHAQAAEDAANEAQQQLQEAEQLLNPEGGSGGASGAAIMLSRSILEDAANAVDRYTASLQQAETLAGAQQGVVQFVQNNHSPESLSASEIYRQSKNLLSVAEVKMASNSVTS